MGWGLVFVSAQEFRTRLWCLIACTDGSLSHIYTEPGLLGLLEVRMESVWRMGKTGVFYLERFNLASVGETVGSHCFGSAGWFSALSGITALYRMGVCSHLWVLWSFEWQTQMKIFATSFVKDLYNILPGWNFYSLETNQLLIEASRDLGWI